MTRTLTLPVEALGSLRRAALGAPDGEVQLRDAGFAAGQALYAAFADHVRGRTGLEPDSLPLHHFLAELAPFFGDRGWGTLQATADAGAETITLGADDWAEGETEPSPTPYPACHFSTGLFAGFLARVAGRPLAVLETRCRATGAERCEFTAGSPDVMDAIWARMTRGAGD